MSMPEAGWAESGQGRRRPQTAWTFQAAASLLAIDLACEAGEIVATDSAGMIYLIDRHGRTRVEPRQLTPVRSLAWSAGGGGMLVLTETRVGWIDRSLQLQWTIDFDNPVLDVATAPFGNVVAVSLGNGETHVFNSSQRRIGSFRTMTPLRFLELVASRQRIVGASDSGLLCAHDIGGSLRWKQTIWSNIGGLATDGNGRTILLASFNHGIQCFNGAGRSRGFYNLGGTVSRVAINYTGEQIVANTQEGSLLWLDRGGQVIWQATPPAEVVAIRCDPLGDSVLCGLSSGALCRIEWPG